MFEVCEFWLLTFENTFLVLNAEKELKQKKIYPELIPVPSEISSGCGVCLKILKTEENPSWFKSLSYKGLWQVTEKSIDNIRKKERSYQNIEERKKMNSIFDWPVFALCDDIRPILKRLMEQKKVCAVATLVGGEGISPRPMGSQMLISEDKGVWGYVSGGCIESNLAEIGALAIKNNKPEFVTFGQGSPYIDIKLLCGKRIDVAVDIIKPEDEATKKLIQFETARKPCLWFSDVNNNQRYCVLSDSELSLDYQMLLSKNPTGMINGCYFKRFVPQLRLIINGANPVAMALIMLARQMGWEVVLNRENGSALPNNLEVNYYRCYSGEKLFKEFELDSSTAVVSLTHDLEADHDIIKYALPSEAFYVGVLGSRKHLPRREQLMTQDDISVEYMQKLKAPIGLDISSSTANEIAIAIIADIIKSFRA